MEKDNKVRIKQINDIVSIVKIISLLFTSIIFFNVFSNFNNSNNINFYYLFMPLLIFIGIYIVWFFEIMKKKEKKHLNKIYFIENLVFISIFYISIIISGGYKSEYKLIFLFIIITSTIQSGLKNGIIVSFTCSFLIIVLDVINGGSNKYLQNDLILSGIFFLTATPLGYYVKIEKNHIEKLKEAINIDSLTGVYNHRYFQESIRKEIQIAKEKEDSLALIFLDIDHFKYYNDLYGHQMGDIALCKVAKILKNNVRKKDIVSRFGGEEFSIILPSITDKEAIIVAERLRDAIEREQFYGEENKFNGKITISVGISMYPNNSINSKELIKTADVALGRAKELDRNRVELYDNLEKICLNDKKN